MEETEKITAILAVMTTELNSVAKQQRHCFDESR